MILDNQAKCSGTINIKVNVHFCGEIEGSNQEGTHKGFNYAGNVLLLSWVMGT